ncbi:MULTISPECIES: conjugal transfer mating-pair stabilization protein TraG [Legionella]|uniref:conjugal transfer mating-pair stabilization protein TraG n=1 Tax=Legionella TaxID=445 RepID=UPI0010418980|nr:MULTISPECIES: conjugal transfer mating-pair stabilization protein TraG [Legionella]
MVTINVLAAGELFQLVLNAIAAFMKQDDFAGLLRITTFIGIVMATVGYVKTRDPMAFSRWFIGYVLIINLVILPKTTVEIYDISSQKIHIVDNIPVVFALGTSIITTAGFGLAQSFDMLFAILPLGNGPIPENLLYTQTGSLFGARLIQASTSFRIINPDLKEEMNQYFRSCVVGDIRLNRKYSVSDLASSTNLWDLISRHPSPLRMTMINGKLVSCLDAAKADGEYSLRKKLDAEIKKAYSFFGINLFGKPKQTTYEKLFETHLTSAFSYYQGLTDASSNIFLQSMMMNAIKDGVSNYQAFTDATAGIVNQQFTKSQVQHRWAWEIGGIKALWFLPLLHTWLTVLLFGVFPLVILLSTIPSLVKIILFYKQLLLSLQLWPVLFAILNAGMTYYGSSTSGEYGQFTMMNLDKIDELHNDISGAAGYIMILIPFLAYGFVSNVGAAFSNLATSMTGHVQGSTMAVAGEAASASFGLGQTSFYNSTANNFSANKHDSNWTHLHGMKTEQASTGVLKTITGSGDAVFDVSPGMTRSHLHLANSEALTHSMNQAFEESKQAAHNEGRHLQTALSNVAHRALQLSELQGHDLRFGEGVSASESTQYSKALSTISHIAEDVAKRTGVSKEDALTHLTSGGWGAQVDVKSHRSILGKLASLGTGVGVSADVHTKFDRSSSSNDRYHTGVDTAISARQAHDFNEAMNVVNNFAQTHHFDDNYSKASQLSNQLGADLREAQTASHNVDASLSKAVRIQQAKQVVESNSAQVTADLNQAFPAYVASRVGVEQRDALYSHPGDLASIKQMEGLANEFVHQKRDELIAKYGQQDEGAVDNFYRKGEESLKNRENNLVSDYQKNSHDLTQQGQGLKVGFDADKGQALQQQVQNKRQATKQSLHDEKQLLVGEQHDLMMEKDEKIKAGMDRAQKNLVPIVPIRKTWGLHTKGE